MKNIRTIPLSLLALLMLSLGTTSCKEDPPPEPLPPSTSNVIVVNEGLSTGGTGTISFYEPLNRVIDNNIFYKNNTYVPGNSLYSIYIDGDRSFLCVAGTGEILVVNTRNMKLIRRIKGLGAPHRMLKITENKFYVTDWQEQGVWVLNVSTGRLVRSIFTGVAPENMARSGNMVFVANSGEPFGDSTVTVIHAIEDTIMYQIPVAHNPQSLLVDNQNMLWVLCSGIEDIQNPFNSTPGVLISYDLNKDSLEYYLPDSLSIDTFYVFPDNQNKPQDFTASNDPNIFYFLDYYKEANLMRFDRNAKMLPAGPHIMGSFNAFGFDRVENQIYLSDPGDNTSAGLMYRYDAGGGQQDVQATGIIPTDFGFR